MKFSVLSAALTALVALAAPAAAAPVQLEQRDVWTPHITSPTANTTWHAGKKYKVTWDTSDAPAQISNGFYVVLRYEGLQLPIILAENFDPRKGSVQVTAPLVAPWANSGNFSIVLFGDSGDWSDDFTIVPA